jgi:DNA polymerase I-like protein with 3'-5' exonuclease and polymerase domains
MRKIVSNSADLDECISAVVESKYIAYDTETTGLNVRKDKVIGIAITTDLIQSFYIPIKVYNGTELEAYNNISTQDIKRLLRTISVKKLLMFNASFDCRITYSNFEIDLIPALYADIMLMKHTCDEDPPFALKDIAKVYSSQLGLDQDSEANKEQIELLDHLKEKGASTTKENYELYKADLEVLAKYACADTELTYKMFNLFSFKLKEDGLEEFFYKEEVMPLYKYVTIPMESKGIPLDLNMLSQYKKDIENDISNLEDSIQRQIKPYLDDFNSWYLDNKYPVKDSGVFAQAAAYYFNVSLPKTKTGKYKLDKKNIESLPPSKFKAFMLGTSRLSDFDIINIQELMHSESADKYKFNLSSKHHLKKLFFDKMNIKPTTFTDKGNPQVDDKFLESIKSEYNFVSDLIDYNSLVKIKGAYIDRFLEEQEDGMFYPSFMQHRTISGRYGSDMQQMPRPIETGEASDLVVKYTNAIRKFFIAGAGHVFVDSDYESLEPHVFAHVSGDPGLISIFKDNKDFYSTIAIQTEKLLGVSDIKDDPNYLGKVAKNNRQKAKAYALGVPYGMEGYALSKHIGCNPREGDKLVRQYLDSFPSLKNWMNNSNKIALEEGKIRSEAGRIRRFPRAVEIGKKYGISILNSLELWEKYNKEPKLYEDMKEIRKELKNYLNNAKNFQIQSLSASIVNRAAIKLSKEFIKFNLSAYICLQIHDELLVRCKEDELSLVSKLMEEIMENNYKLSVPLVAKPSYGINYMEAKG